MKKKNRSLEHQATIRKVTVVNRMFALTWKDTPNELMVLTEVIRQTQTLHFSHSIATKYF